LARRDAPLPSKQELLDFIRTGDGKVGKREIIRAFGLAASDRPALKALMRELEDDGAVERSRGRRLHSPTALPEVTVLDIVGTNADGELLGRPVRWQHEEPPPAIYVRPERRGGPAPHAGQRILARLHRMADDSYEAAVMRVLPAGPSEVVGVFHGGAGGGRVAPTDRRLKHDYAVAAGACGGAESGDLVLAEVLAGQRMGLRSVRVVERLGEARAPRAASLIAIHGAGLPTVFSAEALAEAELGARAAERALADGALPAGRHDLRGVPLVTIDGPDARDFDDAVWAAPDDDSANPGGWRALVAIADVAWFVRPGQALDRDARERGNSAYFPDRVVPMLPEVLSAGACSLVPGEDRLCVAVHLTIDAEGEVYRHRFVRGVMRSAARLTYEQVQAAHEGRPEPVPSPPTGGFAVTDPTPIALVPAERLASLYGVFAALSQARQRRGTLDLDLPERQVFLDADGRVEAILPRPRLDSHRLIEELMIAANVAAAQALEERRQPLLYRVHDRPALDRLESVRELLDSLNLSLAVGQALTPAHFNRLLARAAGTAHAALINEVILRCQAQAVYSPNNIGHFGLALLRYAHFTSPIRRYADLIVHRALIRIFGLGDRRSGGSGAGVDDGLDEATAAGLVGLGEALSNAERRAATAERDALDRYVAAFLVDRVGAVFAGRIAAVTRFGLFVRLEETGADGLLPVSALGDDYYDHDERSHALIGRRHRRTFTLGQPLVVRLAEAEPLTGSVVFTLADSPRAADGGQGSERWGDRGRGGNGFRRRGGRSR